MPLASASYAITKLNDGLTTFYQYAKHTSNTTAPTTGWSDLMPASEAGKFIWRREARALSLGLIGSGDWGGVICLTGATGDPGATGKGIVSITQEYYQSDSMLVLEGGSWGESVPAWSNGKYTWTRTRTNFSDSTSATTDPVCVTGPPGVNGNPGQLGIYADGDTLIVKGFAEDGTLTANHGYIYVGDSRITVTAYSQQLTGEGQGYVVWDGTSVQFAKMQPQQGYVEWLPYNGGTAFSPAYILGKFKKNETLILEESLFTVTSPLVFIKKHFMEVLNDISEGLDIDTQSDVTQINLWASALGIEQALKSLAVINAFVHRLMVNYVESLDYQEDSTGPTNGFKLDGPNNIMKSANGQFRDMVAIGGYFEGSVKHSSFETVKESPPSSPITLAPKTRWLSSQLYDDATSISTTTFTTVTGSYNSESIKSAKKFEATGYYQYATYQSTRDGKTIKSGFIPTANNCHLYYTTGRISSYSPTSGIHVRLSKRLAGSTDSYETDQDHEYSSTGNKSGTFYGLNSAYEYLIGVICSEIVGYSYGYLRSPSFSKGIVLHMNNNDLVHFKYGCFYTPLILISSPSSISSEIEYALASANINIFSALTDGSVNKAQGEIIVNGITETVQGVMKGLSSLTFYIEGKNPITLQPLDGEGVSSGSYNISGEVQIIEQEAGILVRTITPMFDSENASTLQGTDIGNGNKRVRNIFGAGNISGFASISATEVYGARFN